MGLWRMPISRVLTHIQAVRAPCSSRGKHWSSTEVREAFLKYFISIDHKNVPSSSVVPRKREGSYFINAGMNQFKPIFMGTVDPGSELASLERAVNSQKCIRVGGKHNDLEEVGQDTYHHTFFEMLGSWSFGSYFKKDSCEMAWHLLTEVYKLPPSQLYVTYFGGDPSLNLKADKETKNIWLALGVPAERVLPFGAADNFWEMGETGPCGPCTEIHYDHHGSAYNADLVNAGDPRVVELWNLVFMQYNRLADSSLLKLPRSHVDTGMGLERLTAVLQGRISNYDTDLFTPLMDAIHAAGTCPAYQGHVTGQSQQEVDSAYRIVADHSRMIAVALADGLRPGKQETDKKLRQVMYRCFKAAHQVLGLPPGFLASLMPVVAESLGSQFPELHQNLAEICAVCQHTEQRYLDGLQVAQRMLEKAQNKLGHMSQLTGAQIYELCEGQYGKPVRVELLEEMAAEQGLVLDLQGYQEIQQQKMLERQQVEQGSHDKATLSQQELIYLSEEGIPPTDDSFKYDQAAEDIQACVVALRSNNNTWVRSAGPSTKVAILLDSTNFYAEAGGQIGDVGYITTPQENVLVRPAHSFPELWLETPTDAKKLDDGNSLGAVVYISDVQATQKYVLHIGEVLEGTLRVGDSASLAVAMEHREMCSGSHTATHILNYALETTLGKVQQQGSLVTPCRLSFAFTCSKPSLDLQDLRQISERACDVIEAQRPVYKTEIALEDVSQIPGLRTIKDEVYPRHVRVISIGSPLEELMSDQTAPEGLTSVELCGGTHVDNTRDIGEIVITNVQGFEQGTKRVSAITGQLAEQASRRGEELEAQLCTLQKLLAEGGSAKRCTQLTQQIQKVLAGDLLPKVTRDEVCIALEKLNQQGLGQKKNQSLKDTYRQNLETLLNSSAAESVIIDQFEFTKARDLVDVIAAVNPNTPLMLVNKDQRSKVIGICYVPQALKNTLDPDKWAWHVCKHMPNGHANMPKGKYAGRAPTTRLLNFTLDKNRDLYHAMELGRTYAKMFVR